RRTASRYVCTEPLAHIWNGCVEARRFYLAYPRVDEMRERARLSYIQTLSIAAASRRIYCREAAGMTRFAGLRLLGPYLRPHRGRVALALLSLIVAAGTVLALGACLRALIDCGFSQGQPTVLHYALASVLVVAAILAAA